MRSRIPADKREQTKRIFRFGYIALCMMVMSTIFDFSNSLNVSAWIAISNFIVFGIILLAIHFNNTKGMVPAMVISVNTCLALGTVAEGLHSGSYLFLLAMVFALPFLVSNFHRNFIEIVICLAFTICTFTFCIIFCQGTSEWQNISPALYNQMFVFNSVSAASVCTIFSFMGISFEVKYRAELIAAKNKAELHEQKIQKQNAHLQHIAFMNAHIVRSPLANILALTELIDTTANQSECDRDELLQLLKTSALQLDNNIREIVTRATDKVVS